MKKKYKLLLVIILAFCVFGIKSLVRAEDLLPENSLVEDENNTTDSLIEDKNKTSLKIEYEYNLKKNTVNVTIISGTELLNTKPTWVLSKDKLKYSKTFNVNQQYITPVQDIFGNIIQAEINITQIDDKGPEIELDYEYDSETNTVTVTIKSDEILKDTKPTWDLSENKLEYSKMFNNNQKYNTPVYDIWGNVTNVNINVIQIDDKGPKIDVEYEYDDELNTVTVTMKSDEILKDTKPTWDLSKEKLEYSKLFINNQKYNTSVYDIWGNVTNVNINVIQIDDKGPNIEVKYEYDEELNTVAVTMKANEILKDTKPSWDLSEDMLEYSHIFLANKDYTTIVQDKWGNTTNVKLKIHQIDDKPPTIKMEYEYDLTENKIIALMKSNEILGNTKPTWILSEDRLVYSKIFDASNKQDYSTTVQDRYGNECWVKIKFQTTKYSYNNTTGPNITVRYLYDSTERVTAYIISDKKLLNTKPTWNLDASQTIYTKKYTDNQMYTTTVKDIDGNEVKVSIVINFFKTTFKGIDVSSHQGEIDWRAVKASGIDFAIIRVGYRGWGTGRIVTDTYFERNIQEAARNGVDIGLYFYSQAINTNEAREEARYAINVATKYNIDIKFPIVIDSEKSSEGRGRADNLSRETRTTVVKAFCDEVRNLGHTPMIYASKNWFYNNLNIQSLSQYEVWLAHYTTSTDYKYPYNIWQYTSSGSVAGINGNVDMNICYKRY